MSRVRLEATRPFDWERQVNFFAGRATPGVEDVRHGTYRRTLRVDGEPRIIEATCADNGKSLSVLVHDAARFDARDLRVQAGRVFDVAAPVGAISRHLLGDPTLARLLADHPGVRVPGAWDGFELTVRAILGQQISVKAATTIAGRIAHRYGEKLGPRFDGTGSGLDRLFPTAEKLSRARFNNLGLVQSRIDTIKRIAAKVAGNELRFDGSQSRDEWKASMLDTRGIGPWTAEYVAMRALKDPDAFPGSDLGLLSAIEHPRRVLPKALEARAERWRPWRAYAAMLLWGSLPGAGG
jgi:AraC family transcriptional regulator of adaptative response / DNA-3-methyladenine glycosylase II